MKVEMPLVEWLKENRHNDHKWLDGNLPECPEAWPTITFTALQVKQYRNDFRALLEFAAHVLGKEAKDVCVLDIIAHRLNLRDKE